MPARNDPARIEAEQAPTPPSRFEEFPKVMYHGGGGLSHEAAAVLRAKGIHVAADNKSATVTNKSEERALGSDWDESM